MGAQVQFDAEVVDVDPENCQVTLKSGEMLSGDVLVGADGELGPSRRTVLGKEVLGTPTGLVMYEYVVFLLSRQARIANLRAQYDCFQRVHGTICHLINMERRRSLLLQF